MVAQTPDTDAYFNSCIDFHNGVPVGRTSAVAGSNHTDSLTLLHRCSRSWEDDSQNWWGIHTAPFLVPEAELVLQAIITIFTAAVASS